MNLIGCTLKDNDPRMKQRTLVVYGVGLSTPKGESQVLAKDKVGREFRILMRRIHIDGKPRKSGFTLVTA
jgi:hypothetical protein